MANKDQRRRGQKDDHPETEPYAPPNHRAVNVPEQQFEGNPKDRSSEKPRDKSKDH